MRKTFLPSRLNNVEVRAKKIHLVLEMSEQTTITPTRFFAIFIEVEEPSLAFIDKVKLTLCQLIQFILTLNRLEFDLATQAKHVFIHQNLILLGSIKIQDFIHFLFTKTNGLVEQEAIGTIATPKDIPTFETSNDLVSRRSSNSVFCIRSNYSRIKLLTSSYQRSTKGECCNFLLSFYSID